MKLKHKLIGGRWVMRSLFRRGRTWYGRVRDSRTGLLREISTRERDKERGAQKVIDYINELERREQDSPEPGYVRFDLTYEEFLSLKQVRPSTMRDYRSSFEAVLQPAFGQRLVAEIELADMERFLKVRRESSPRTRQKHLTMLRSFFRWARRRKYCTEDPTDGIKIRGLVKHVGVALTVDQARALLVACQTPVIHSIQDRSGRRKQGQQAYSPPKHLFLAVLIALHTGLRRGNVTRLCLRQIDLGQRKITIPASEMKAGRPFVIPIHPELAEVLADVFRERNRLDPDEPVIGREIKEIKKSFKTALGRAGLPSIRWHDLRHTASTWWSERCTVQVQKALMGHSINDVTFEYTHTFFETMKRVVDSMPLLLTPLMPDTQAAQPAG